MAKKKQTEAIAALQKKIDVVEGRGRGVAYIPADAFVDGKGWRVAIVFENEDGFYPTGSTPEGGDKEPWWWGKTREDYAEAVACARTYNLERLGLSDSAVMQIISRSMGKRFK